MGNFNLNSVFNILSRVLFGSVIALPLSLSNYSLSHQEGLNLKYSKTAPPLAIFDDEKSSTDIEDTDAVIPGKKQYLKTNRLQTRQMALKISRKFATLQKAAAVVMVPKAQPRTLAGRILQKSSTRVATM